MRGFLRSLFVKTMARLGYRVESMQAPRITVANLLEQEFRDRPDVVFLQVGAHDGNRNDPVAPLRGRPGWSGVMVEANPVVFPRLQQNLVSTPAIKAVNVAVAPHGGTVAFTIIREPEATRCPTWADQISSLSQEHVLKTLADWGHTREEASTLLSTLEVPCQTFDDLLTNHDIKRLDLLMLDVEGMDFKLLELFPFERCSPEWIVFESSHLNAAELQALPGFLCRQGYAFLDMGEDTVCHRRASR